MAPAESDDEATGIHCRLDELLAERGMTLDALAAAVGRAPSQLSMIENGRREPRLSMLRLRGTSPLA